MGESPRWPTSSGYLPDDLDQTHHGPPPRRAVPPDESDSFKSATRIAVLIRQMGMPRPEARPSALELVERFGQVVPSKAFGDSCCAVS